MMDFDHDELTRECIYQLLELAYARLIAARPFAEESEHRWDWGQELHYIALEMDRYGRRAAKRRGYRSGRRSNTTQNLIYAAFVRLRGALPVNFDLYHGCLFNG